jgi:hypothetical protein
MKWNQWMAGLVVAFGATVCLAETPNLSADSPQAMSLMQRGRMLGGLNWWNRYGEAVNATALAQAEALPADKGPAAMPFYGDGYIFGPGSCDCPAPCIGNLWAGYFQNPWRCDPESHRLFNHCGHCGGCGPFGKGCCSRCGKSCSAGVSCGCTTPAAVSCTTAAPSCGCKPVCGKCRSCHIGHWKGFSAHWHKPCKSCASPVSCGCTTPVISMPSEKQADQKYPSPLPAEPVLYSLPRLN